MATKIKKNDISTVADRLGEIKAQIADLAKQEAELRDRLIESGCEAVEGDLFRATISHNEVATTDWRAVVESFDMTPALKRKITINTCTSKRVTVRVNSR